MVMTWKRPQGIPHSQSVSKLWVETYKFPISNMVRFCAKKSTKTVVSIYHRATHSSRSWSPCPRCTRICNRIALVPIR